MDGDTYLGIQMKEKLVKKSWMEEALLCSVKRKLQKSIYYAYIFL